MDRTDGKERLTHDTEQGAGGTGAVLRGQWASDAWGPAVRGHDGALFRAGSQWPAPCASHNDRQRAVDVPDRTCSALRGVWEGGLTHGDADGRARWQADATDSTHTVISAQPY